MILPAASSRMIAVSMRDDRVLDRAMRIDVEAARWAVEPLLRL